MDDIEDLASNVGELSTQRAPRKRVIPKKFTTQLKHETPIADSVIPGTQSVSLLENCKFPQFMSLITGNMQRIAAVFKYYSCSCR